MTDGNSRNQHDYYQLSSGDDFFVEEEIKHSASQQPDIIYNIRPMGKISEQCVRYFMVALIFGGALLAVIQKGDLLSKTFTNSWASLLFSNTGETANVLDTDLLLSSTGQRPNIVFILADDMGYNSLQKEVTPFLVSMRDEGIKLTRYYSQELCTPSRASLMTGRYPLSLGLQHGSINVQTNGTLGINETTIADVLKANGYTNYMYGKWNLGNASPRYLPTARGFHQYMGFLSAENDYWSKRAPSNSVFTDLLYSDTECYYMYDGVDLKHYSTNMYRERAVVTIENHNFEKSPMFLFMSFQAPHAPFADLAGVFDDGVPKSYVNEDLFNFVNSTYAGGNHKQYFLSLAILDSAVSDIYDALEARNVTDNTYFIFASDNGGCPASGGRNIPLRGGKSTLFEGGTLVESFVYHKRLPQRAMGTAYAGLFHVSDWFPTILNMAKISYEAAEGYALDGVNQLETMINGVDEEYPRDHVLYNFYINVEGQLYDLFTRGGAAIRNEQYKLMHTYLATEETWFTTDMTFINDDDLSNLLVDYCDAPNFSTGNYTYFLFDLENDPLETTNLYNTSAEAIAVQDELYTKLKYYQAKSRRQYETQRFEDEVLVKWHENYDYVTPWVHEDEKTLAAEGVTVPKNCGLYSAVYFDQINPILEIE